MGLQARPCTITEARRLVSVLGHRHNLPPKGGLFAVAATSAGQVVGVAIAGRPVARLLNDGATIEVTRVTTDGHRNACSFLHGRIHRAARALGYRRCYTYTLASEDGASLRASGYTLDATLPARASWDGGARHRVQTDLFGAERRPSGPKLRWVVMLAALLSVEGTAPWRASRGCWS